MNCLDYVQTDFVRLSSRSLSEVCKRFGSQTRRNGVHDEIKKADTNIFPFPEEVPAKDGKPARRSRGRRLQIAKGWFRCLVRWGNVPSAKESFKFTYKIKVLKTAMKLAKGNQTTHQYHFLISYSIRHRNKTWLLIVALTTWRLLAMFYLIGNGFDYCTFPISTSISEYGSHFTIIKQEIKYGGRRKRERDSRRNWSLVTVIKMDREIFLPHKMSSLSSNRL